MTSDSAPRIADSCVCDISIEAFADLSGGGEVLKGVEMGLRWSLLGFGKEEEDVEEDELGLGETREGLREAEKEVF